jgi:hypothetical protein
LVVQNARVALVEAAGVRDRVLQVGRHVVHEAEDGAARGLGYLDGVWIELTEGVSGEPLRGEFRLDRRHDERPERAKVAGSDVGGEHREQRPGVGQ